MVNTTAITLLADSMASSSNNSAATDGQIGDENRTFICAGPTDEEFTFYLTIAWWLEGFGIILVGSLGEYLNIIIMDTKKYYRI